MNLWIGVTDFSWFERLAAMRPDEVNFWQPSGKAFKVLQPGEPFLFKLHSPNNYIVGGGFFVRNAALPLSLAWDAFQTKNGVSSLGELRASIGRFRAGDATIDPIIGCNVLVEPFFFDRSDWIPIPDSFALNIVSGKRYDTGTSEGAAVWDRVQRVLGRRGEMREPDDQPEERRFGEAYLARGRLGQGAFRVLVTEAYERRCAITGERTLPVLQAAHIQPFSELGPHRVSNGILLRSDLHTLFDLGYLTITRDYHMEVSPRLKEEWQNGRVYYAHHGQRLPHLPSEPNRPSQEFLDWHNVNRYRS